MTDDEFIMSMSDEEFNRRIREFTGEPIEEGEPELDPRYTEKHDYPTISGGDFSVAYFYDAEGKPCEKDKAKRINIVEYKEGWKRISEHYLVTD